MTEAPPPDPEAPIRVTPGALQRDPEGAAWIELHDADGRFVIVWLRADEAAQLQAALDQCGVQPAEPGDASSQETTRDVWLYHRSGHAYRARFTTIDHQSPQRSIECAPAEGLRVAARDGAAIYVSERLLATPAYGGYPPANWRVCTDPDPSGALSIRRRPPTRRDWAAHLVRTAAAGAVAATIVSAAIYTRTGWLAFIAVLPASGMRLGHLWLAVRPERWEVGENSLLVERSLLGIRWRRRYLGATLHLTQSSRDWQSAIVLTIERGKSGRRLATSLDGDSPITLGQFVSAYTGWKLVNHLAAAGSGSPV